MSASPHPRPAQSELAPKSKISKCYPYGFEPMPPRIESLDRRLCWRNNAQQAIFRLVNRVAYATPTFYDDGHGPSGTITVRAAMAAANCEEREAGICLRDLIDSGICDRPDGRGEATLSGEYRIRPDRFESVRSYAERDQRRKDREREVALKERKAGASLVAPEPDPPLPPPEAEIPPEHSTGTIVVKPGDRQATTLRGEILRVNLRARNDSAGAISYHATVAGNAVDIQWWASKPGSHFPSVTESLCENTVKSPQDTDSYRSAVAKVARDWNRFLQDQPHLELLSEIVSALDKTPVEIFDHICNTRLRKLNKDSLDGKHSPKFLVYLAAQAKVRHDNDRIAGPAVDPDEAASEGFRLSIARYDRERDDRESDE